MYLEVENLEEVEQPNEDYKTKSRERKEVCSRQSTKIENLGTYDSD